MALAGAEKVARQGALSPGAKLRQRPRRGTCRSHNLAVTLEMPFRPLPGQPPPCLAATYPHPPFVPPPADPLLSRPPQIQQTCRKTRTLPTSGQTAPRSVYTPPRAAPHNHTPVHSGPPTLSDPLAPIAPAPITQHGQTRCTRRGRMSPDMTPALHSLSSVSHHRSSRQSSAASVLTRRTPR